MRMLFLILWLLPVFNALAQTAPAPMSEADKLYALSVEKGMASALRDFHKPKPAQKSSQVIIPSQMEEVLKKAVTVSASPKLLIYQQGKLRVMTLSADDARK